MHGVKPRVHVEHELVEVAALARRERRGLVHEVHHHALAAAHLAVKVHTLSAAVLEPGQHIDGLPLRRIRVQAARRERRVVRCVQRCAQAAAAAVERAAPEHPRSLAR